MKCLINRPDYYDGDQIVYLTASVTSNGVTQKKQFKFFIKKADMTDEQSVAEDKKWLQENMPLIIDKDIDVMKINPLPYGSTVSWSSTNEDYITIDGTVTRPDFGFPNENASLTAALQKGTASDSIEFDVTISAMTSEDELTLVARKITWDLIKLENEHKSRIMTPLNLLKSLDGVTISWSSTEPTVITTEGQVKRPSYDKNDVPVTLTATLTKEGKSMSVVIDGLKVIKESPTANQRCELFVNNAEGILNYITAKGTNSNTAFQEIRESFVLPAEEEGMAFVWSLTNSAGSAAGSNSYISIAYQDGVSGVSDKRYTVTVNRPTGSDVSTYLKVTATISEIEIPDGENIPGGNAEKIYAIKVLDSQETSSLSINSYAFSDGEGQATWSRNIHERQQLILQEVDTTTDEQQ